MSAIVCGSLCRAQPSNGKNKEQRDHNKISDSDLERERRAFATWITSLMANSIETGSNHNHPFCQTRTHLREVYRGLWLPWHFLSQTSTFLEIFTSL